MAVNPKASQGAKPGFNLGVSGVGQAQGQKLRVPIHFRADNTLAVISNQYADGVAVIDLPTGAYTYRGFHLSLINTAEIVGKTFGYMGRHHVNTANWPEYVERISLEIDGKVEQDFYTDELIDLNKLFNHDTMNGDVVMTFGSPGWFKEDMPEDAYLLGTGNVKSLRLLVKLKAAFPATMKLAILCEYAPIIRPIGWLVTTRRTRYSFNAAGEVTITDLPHGLDVAAIWVRSINSKNVANVSLEVDQQMIFDATTHEIRALSALWGKDIAALPSRDIFLDFWRDYDGKGLASITSAAQIRRQAQIRLSLNFIEADAQIYAITLHCGPYLAQR